MKQKKRFLNFGNIGYRSMNGKYISIGPQKNIGCSLIIIFYLKPTCTKNPDCREVMLCLFVDRVNCMLVALIPICLLYDLSTLTKL